MNKIVVGVLIFEGILEQVSALCCLLAANAAVTQLKD